MVSAMTRTVNRGFPTSNSSTSGHRTRFSTTMNTASATSEPANAMTVGADNQPSAAPDQMST